MREDFIEPTMSEQASPVDFAPKADGSLRSCVDYRELSAVAVRDVYSLPRMDEFVKSFKDAHIFSTLDASRSYLQI